MYIENDMTLKQAMNWANQQGLLYRTPREISPNITETVPYPYQIKHHLITFTNGTKMITRSKCNMLTGEQLPIH